MITLAQVKNQILCSLGTGFRYRGSVEVDYRVQNGRYSQVGQNPPYNTYAVEQLFTDGHYKNWEIIK